MQQNVYIYEIAVQLGVIFFFSSPKHNVINVVDNLQQYYCLIIYILKPTALH